MASTQGVDLLQPGRNPGVIRNRFQWQAQP